LPNEFTKIETRILDLLSNGLRHHKSEVLDCLEDELASLPAMRAHLVRLRKKLAPKGQDITCEFRNNTVWYRHIRLLNIDS